MTYLWLCLASLAAGAINAIAGGGTLLTFPTLLTVMDGVHANGTSTLALVPGSMAAAWGFRREVKESRGWLVLLVPPCLLGGLIGTLLVTRSNPKVFDALIPWLILTAAVLFLLQPVLIRFTGVGLEHAPPTRLAIGGIILFQFVVAIYGGYFGAGIGILMISALSLIGVGDIIRVNALKTLLASCINAVSAITWVVERKVEWKYALIMAAVSIVGGYLGAHYSRRLNKTLVRWAVIAIGFGLAAFFFWKRFGAP
jgi:uncharacterized membrane protein YfcA